MQTFAFEDAGQWEAWLADHHDSEAGAWLMIAKKGSGRTTLTITEALDVALCYGWIDSLRRSHDDSYYLQKYSPRRPKGAWSKVNVEKVAALIAAGRMRPAGWAEVEAAKADGRWDAAYEAQRSATVPDDLAQALAANEKAKAAFEKLGKTDRYAMILQLMKARRPETRAARLNQIVSKLDAS